MSNKNYNKSEMNGNQEEENYQKEYTENGEGQAKEEQNQQEEEVQEESAEEETSEQQGSKDELEKTKEEYQELHEKYLRLYSEFENFRRRSRKEASDAKEKGRSEMVLAILPVLDDFERALNSMKENQGEAENEMYEGVELIFNKFKNLLSDQGLQEMEVVGQEFDPEYHEAMTKMQAPSEDQKGKVIEEVQKGYVLNDRIVRHAKVVVGE